MNFDFDAAVTAPFRMQPGLRRMASGAPQLTPLAPGSPHQREKLAVLSAYLDLCLCQTPGFDPAPALRALASQAAAEHPAVWAWDGCSAQALGVRVTDGKVELLAPLPFGLGDEVARCLRGLPPEWRLTGLLSLAFAEDFAIIDAASGTLPWMAVTLPSFWAPQDKVGRHFTAVHAPVADNALLIQAAESLMRLVSGDQRWERFVWTVTSHPRLHAHPRHVEAERWPGGRFDAAHAWWRSEHQTFIPLPGLRQAVFTIGVEVSPLAQATATPARATRLHDAIASMSPAVLDYRSLSAVREPLLAWLGARKIAVMPGLAG